MTDSPTPRQPREPRQPLRAERKPSDWSTRPIPQPAPERRTADPDTPTLKELAARAAQRASLTAERARGPGVGAGALQPALYNPNNQGATPQGVRELAPAQCAGAWDTVGRETQQVLARGVDPRSGRMDVLRRNEAITAGYARLYQAEPRLRWAGVAAFASKQVGCGIRDARAISEAPDSLLERVPPVTVPVAAGQTALEARRDAARHMEGALGRGNEAVFRDIYPTHRFYQEHGISGLRTCAGTRPGGRVPPQVLQGFEELDEGTDAGMRAGAERVLRYEQRETLQAAVYDDRTTAALLLANQASFKAGEATRWAGGDRIVRAVGARPVEVNFTSACEGTPSERFDGLNLANFDERWPYAQRVANRFHAMVEGGGAGQIQRELEALAGGSR